MQRMAVYILRGISNIFHGYLRLNLECEFKIILECLLFEKETTMTA